MDSMMHDVVRRGTATRAAAVLKRSDLAGKTGTTNDSHRRLVLRLRSRPWSASPGSASTSPGKHRQRRNRRRAAALPIWIGFMEHALKGVPESWQETPEGLVTIVAHDPSGKTTKELIYKEHLPAPPVDAEAEEPKQEPTQEPAPVTDAKPKPVEKPAAQKSAEKKN
jgi:penicillin-binding protein 1A